MFVFVCTTVSTCVYLNKYKKNYAKKKTILKCVSKPELEYILCKNLKGKKNMRTQDEINYTDCF